MKVLFFVFLSLGSCLLINNFCLAGYSGFDCDRILRRDFPVEAQWNDLSLQQQEELARLDYGVGLSRQWVLRGNGGSRISVEDLITHQIMMPTGANFERVLADEIFGHLGVTYADVETGLRWSSPLKERMNWYDADQACRKLGPGSRLPTKEEHKDLVNKLGKDNENRLNALLPKHPVGNLYWSSSVHPGLSHYAYSLNGYYGDIDYYYRSYDGDYYAVRCVRSSSR